MKSIIIVLILLLSNQAIAMDVQETRAIEDAFKKAGVEGTFVLYDVQEKTHTGYNSSRAAKRFIPASTFKIANSLIGLSVGAVKNVDDILPYGGKPQYLDIWEHDMSLRAAIKISNYPIYQELARRIGLKDMQENIDNLNYGNKTIGNFLDNFWVEGPLKISALEQVQFLSRLTLNTLPYSAIVQQQVRDILELERTDKGILYAKTGWTTTPDPGIGWWVGWVKREDRIYCFALNIDIKSRDDLKKRMELGKVSLKILGIL